MPCNAGAGRKEAWVIRSARVLLLTSMCVLICWPHQQAQAQTAEKILLAWPIQGHSGDTFYLSGYGFLPHAQLSFIVACPNYFDPSVSHDGNYHLYPGPKTDKHGDFSGYPIAGFELKVLPSSPCQIAANYANQPTGSSRQQSFVSTQNALYYIVARNQRLLARARFIEGRVHATPQQVRAGVVHERITVTGCWGGAMANVSIRFPHQKSRVVASFRLNWEGQGTKSIPISAPDPGVATVSVSFTLGKKHGNANTKFTVVR